MPPTVQAPNRPVPTPQDPSPPSLGARTHTPPRHSGSALPPDDHPQTTQNENVWEWIQVEHEAGNGLVVSAVADGARKRGVTVGDTLVECVSTSDRDKHSPPVPLSRRSHPEQFRHAPPMQPPLVLVLWRTAPTSVVRGGGWTGSSALRHMGYKAVNVRVGGKEAVKGLGVGQPRRDVLRFQVSGLNPSAAENG